MKYGRLAFLVCLAAVLAMSTLLGACAAEPATTPTTTTPAASAEPVMIKVGMGPALTGPYATTCTPLFDGCKDYLTSVNDNGGFTANGKTYKYDILWADTKADVPTGVATYKRFAEEGCVVYQQTTTAEASAQNPIAMQLKMPIIGSGGTDDQIKNNQLVYTYMFDVPYQISFPIGVKWFKENRFKGTGKMKVARLYVDLAMGKIADTPAVNEIIEDMGCELLPVEWFPATITDFTPYLLRIRDAKPDLVLVQAIADPFALCLKDAVRLGMDVTNPQFMGGEWAGVNSAFLKAAGPAAEGALNLYYYRSFWEVLDNSSNPDMQKLLDIAEKYQKTRRPPENYSKGLGQGTVIHTAISRAVKNSGSATIASVQAELSKFENVELVVTAPITWANGMRCAFYNGVLTVKDGKLSPITPVNLGAVPGQKEKMPYLWGGGIVK